METISNATCTKCQHCGQFTNYAGDEHQKARESLTDKLMTACKALIDLVDLAQEDVSHHEYETIRSITMEQAKKAIAKAEAAK